MAILPGGGSCRTLRARLSPRGRSDPSRTAAPFGACVVQRAFQGTPNRQAMRAPSLRRVLALLCAQLVLGSVPTRSHSQERTDLPAPGDAGTDRSQPPAEALEHYAKGRALYKAGHYREALEELQQALEIGPESPNLVYNVARLHELLGEIDSAIRQYRRYRELLSPDQSEEIARIDSTLQRLEGAREQVVVEPRPETTPPKLVSPAPVRQRGVADGAFWTTASLAAAALAAGGAVGALALEANREASHFVIGKNGDAHERDRKALRADRMALSSDLTLLGGVTLGITALLLYALRHRTAREAAAPAPRAVVELGACSGGAVLSFKGQL
jgi:tetratricopeptide (TPR) repeat protein